MGKCDLGQGVNKGVLTSGIGIIWLSNDTEKDVLTHGFVYQVRVWASNLIQVLGGRRH